jgi:hypothetical protein
MHLDQIPVVLDTANKCPNAWAIAGARDSVPIVEVKGRVLVVPSKLSPWHVLGGLRYCLCLVFMCCCPSHSLACFPPSHPCFFGVVVLHPGRCVVVGGGG